MRNQNIVNIDWITIFLYITLVVLGIINLYAASYRNELNSIFDFKSEHGKQIFWFGISLFVGFIALLINGEFYQQNAYWFYFAAMLLMILVLFTKPINGARSWFGIGSIGIQPSEFAKLGIALAVSKSLSSINVKVQDFNYVLRSNLILIFPVVLVMLQPDAGTCLIYASILLVFYREGMRYDVLFKTVFSKFIFIKSERKFNVINNFIPIFFALIFLIISTLLINKFTVEIPFYNERISGYFAFIFLLTLIFVIFYFLVKKIVVKRRRKIVFLNLLVFYLLSVLIIISVRFGFNKLPLHQKTRIELFLGLENDPNGEDYNRFRAMSAVGSGSIYGRGYKNAIIASPKYKHVPMQSTDFIFSTLAEEWGFVGSCIIISLFLVLFIRLIYLAERQRSHFSRVFIYSVVCIIFFHFLINIGMVIGLAPVIGVPLPFFSYGGSALMVFSILIFISIKLDSERKIVLR